MNGARRLALAALLLGLPAAAGAQQAGLVDAEHLKAWIDSKRQMVIVDSRNEEEYAQAHLPGAISIPADQTIAQAARLPRDKRALVVFYCRGSGCTLSQASAAAAAQLGYTYLLVYQAGMPDWLLKGYPVEKGRDARAPRAPAARTGASH